MLKNQTCIIENKLFFLKWLLSILLITPFSSASAQNESEKGIPFITNYTVKIYDGTAANWSIIQDKNGIMYFGQTNRKSNLLQYDGVKWKKMAAPPSSLIVRCTTRDKDGTIYYGASGDFGYLNKDSVGETFEYSLLQFVPKEKRNFLDIWSVQVTDEGIYFQSRERLFLLTKSGKGNSPAWITKSWEPSTHFMYSFYLDHVLYVHEQSVGLLKMVNDSLVLIPGSEFLGADRMQVMLPYTGDVTQKDTILQKEYLASTFTHGIYVFDGKKFKPFKTEADSLVRKYMVYKGIPINGNYALSLLGYGLIIINPQGKIVQVISRSTAGLPSDIIYSIYADLKGDVWLGLDNGISKIAINSPFTVFNSQSGILAAPLSIAKLPDGSFYVGTNNGLFHFNRATSKFELVDNIPRNQIFHLVVDGNTLLVTNDGLFMIKDGKTMSVQPSISNNLKTASLFISKKYPDVLYAGTTFGVDVFLRDAAKPTGWQYLGNIPNLKDEIRFFAETEDGRMWATTLNGKPYRITLSFDANGKPDISKTQVENLSERLNNSSLLGNVFTINHKVYFTSDSGTHIFNEEKKRFEEATFIHFHHFTGREDSTGKVWLADGVGRDSVQFFIATPQTNGSYQLDSTSLLPLLDQSPFDLYPDKNGIVWFISNDGLIRYDQKIKRNVDPSYKTLIRSIAADKQQLNPVVIGGTPPEIKFNNNSLRFEYAAPFYEQEDKVEYQTWLEGFEKKWSDWGKNTYKEYTNLSPGKYTFHVRAKNLYHQISEEAVYSFTILSPWYRTWWAYVIYALIFLLAGYLILKWRIRKLKEQHRELEKTVEERTSQLSQRVGELAVINSVQSALVSELDMNAIYKLVGERIREIFKAQVIDIVTYDRTISKIEDRYSFEKGDRTLLGQREPTGFRKQLIDTGKAIIINKDYDRLSAESGNKVLIGDHPKSFILVPLTSGNAINGMISIQNLDKENTFSETDINLITTLANSMSIALENARLFDETTRLLKETEQRTAELAVINSVQDGLAKELDMQGIYNLVGHRVQKLFNAQVVQIATFDHENKLENFNYHFEKGETSQPASRPFDKIRKHLIETGQNILINEDIIKAVAEYGMKVVPGTEMPKSILFMPLKAGDKVSGYVSLQNIDKENAFSYSDVRLLSTLSNSMSVALENARLFDETTRLLKETEQRTTELAVINSVQEGLAKELDMQAIYELVGNKIQKVFNAQVVVICTLDQETKSEHFKYHFEKGELSFPDPRPYDKLRQHLIDTKEKFLISNHDESIAANFGMRVVPGTELPKSLLFVPLISGDKVKSYVSLQNIDKENAFSESDVKLLETLANSMSVALENARLFEETNRLLKETEQRTAELAVINSVQEGLAKELDMQAIYNMVGEKIRDVFDAQVVIIATFDHEAQVEYFKYVIEKGNRFYPELRPLDKLRLHLIKTRQKIVINNHDEKTAAEYGMKVGKGTEFPKSLVFVPLVVGEKINSYISLQNVDKENAFTESDVRLLETLSNSMSVALENARLFDETTRLLKETEQRSAELSVINSVQEGLAKELDMQAIYDLVGERISKVFNAQAMIIASLNPETKTEHFNYVIEKGERFYLNPRPYDKLREHLIETKEKILVNTNFEEAAARFGLNVLPGTKHPKSLLFVPLIIGDKVKSYVSLQNIDIENAFSESDVRLLETLANSMSVALENARLFDETNRLLKETEQKTGELAVINSVQDGLVREMNMQSIYDLVGNRICELFDTQTVIIRTFNHTNGNEEWQFAIEKGIRLHSEPRPFIWANKRLIEFKQSILINENYVEYAARHGGTGVSKGLPPKSALFVPMIVGDVVRGSVSLQNVEKENAFSENDLRLLTTLTNSMSVALENARLFDETTHLLADAKQRASELATVNSVSKALAAQLNPDELIQLVGDQMKDLFKANIVYLALLNKKTRIIDFAYQYGEVMPSRKIGEGLTSKIILSGEPLFINADITGKAEALGIQQMGLPAASYLGVPIPVGDEIIGVLSVQSTERENRFNENDLRLLTTIASSVGVALKNAQLFEDVEQAKKEAELSSKTAEKANEAKSAFLSTVSHELRTPLTSVLGFAKIIKKRLEEKVFPALGKTDAKTEKTVDQISENLKVVISEGERLTHLINDVLDLAKIEAGKMEWNQESVSLPEVVERAVAATTSLFDQKDIKLVKRIDTDIPNIIGDTDKLIQVVINLFSNAVKFTDSGAVTCTLTHTNEEVIVSIADTGIGIAKEDFAAVFEQFKQVGGDTLTDKPKGTGLGLPICKEIIEHHGGRIWLESEPGKGSIFSFALPLVPSSPKIKETPIHLSELMKQLKEQMVFSKLKMGEKDATILVVDDDDSIRSLLHQELSDAGYIIEEAKDGKMALECIRKNRPDLIILDVMMPEINGFDVAAILKNDPQTMDIPIIILSIVQDKARGFRIGVDRYLTKPIDTVKLFEEVGNLLEQGKSKKKVMVVDEDSSAVRSLTEVLQAKGYIVVESDGKELVEKAISTQPDIIILNSVLSDKNEIVQSLRFEKGLENVLFLIYQ